MELIHFISQINIQFHAGTPISGKLKTYHTVP